MQKLAETVRLLLADHKGLLAMDESNGACNKRFAAGHPADRGRPTGLSGIDHHDARPGGMRQRRDPL
jgi:hypothetical protein